MKITVITLFPKMVSGFFEESIIKRAIEKKLVELKIINLRDFAIDDYGKVDDRPYGGGAGMVIRVDVVYKALQSVILTLSEERNDESKWKDLATKGSVKRQKNASLDSSSSSTPWNDRGGRKIVLTSPRGKVYNQNKAQEYSKLDHLIIIAGHYEGVDERVMEFIDEEISIGDFVLTGGEIPAATIVDSVVRLIPGVLKKKDATKNETFNINGKKILEYPQYTRPEEFKGLKVPEVLLGGNHKEIEKWRLDKSLQETKKRRPDLLDTNK